MHFLTHRDTTALVILRAASGGHTALSACTANAVSKICDSKIWNSKIRTSPDYLRIAAGQTQDRSSQAASIGHAVERSDTLAAIVFSFPDGSVEALQLHCQVNIPRQAKAFD